MTMRIDVPEGKHPVMFAWGEAVPGIGPAAAAFAQSVYSDHTLGLREFEAARLRIAQLNGCLFCLDWRTEQDGATVEDGFLEAVEQWRTTDAFDERTRMAAEYAERYATDHLGLDGDEDFWARFSACFSQREQLELTMCLGSWLAFGRLNHVFGLDAACTLPVSR